MIVNRIRILLLSLILLPLTILSQDDKKEFNFPDIPGYVTLKCDFHMHTVFSDGLVWPTTRVDEAVSEGLDAIAISDHLEYWSHKNHLKGDHNTSYEIAKPYAEKKDLILIRACEITKSMPPGHFNCLFIQDANAIDSVDWKKAIIQASEQGAYVFWNHPGWRQEDEIPIWYDDHSWLLSQGLIQGIEIVNENSYYPLAHRWALDSNLTILGNSDIHDPVDYFYNRAEGEHRPITLVFAKERSEEGIREALDNGRTAVYYKDKVLGDEKYLKELFYESIQVWDMLSQPVIEPEDPEPPDTHEQVIVNNSSIPILLETKSSDTKETIVLLIPAGESIPFEFGTDYLLWKWTVKNFVIAPDKSLEIDYIN